MASPSIPSSPAPPASQSVRSKASTRPAAEEAPDAASGGFAALLGFLGGAVPMAEEGGCGAAALVPAALPSGMGQPGGEAPELGGLLPPQLRRAGSLVAETARMDNALESAPPGGGAGRPAGRPGTAGAALSAQTPAPAKSFRMPAAKALPGTASAHGTLLAPSAPSGAAGTAVPERLEGAAGLAAALRRALEGAAAAPASPALAHAVAQPAGGDNAAGSRAPCQGASAVAGADLPPSALQAEGAPGSPPGSDSVPGPEGHNTPDAVTEQVAYWATDALQNAELTLAHEGRPVEVSVSLEGQHAHVAFRSDQSDTRALLDAGTGQLRDLLGQEGLVLSGVTVGSSQADSQHPQGRGSSSETARSRAAARQAQGAADAPATGERLLRTGVLSERKVDLFV